MILAFCSLSILSSKAFGNAFFISLPTGAPLLRGVRGITSSWVRIPPSPQSKNPRIYGGFALDIDLLVINYLCPILGNFRPIYLQFTCMDNQYHQTMVFNFRSAPRNSLSFLSISDSNIKYCIILN